MADAEFLDALRTNAAEVLDDLCSVDEVHRILASEEGDAGSLWSKVAELGWLMLAVPEEQGGMGGGIAEAAILQQAYGAHITPLPSLGTALLTEAVKAWPNIPGALLEGLANGDIVGGVADLSGAPALTFTEGDTPQLDGETIVVDGIGAHWLLVAVSTATSQGIALLPRDAPGVTLSRRPIADRTRSLATLACRATPVETGHYLFGDPGADVIARLMRYAALLLASDCIGGANTALEVTIDYLKTRVQFGKPIGSFQALKHRAAELKVKLEMARELVAAAIARADEADAALWSSMAKFTACETYRAVAAEMVQMHGGIGFTAEHSAHLHLKRACFNGALFGTSAVHLDRAAEALVTQVA